MVQKDLGLVELDYRGRIPVTMTVAVAMTELVAISNVQERR